MEFSITPSTNSHTLVPFLSSSDRQRLAKERKTHLHLPYSISVTTSPGQTPPTTYFAGLISSALPNHPSEYTSPSSTSGRNVRLNSHCPPRVHDYLTSTTSGHRRPQPAASSHVELKSRQFLTVLTGFDGPNCCRRVPRTD